MRAYSFKKNDRINTLINTISVSKIKALAVIANATLYFIHFYISFLVK